MTDAAIASLDEASIRKSVDASGLCTLDAQFDDAYCAAVKAFIDKFPSEEAEVNYDGTELRIWRAHERDGGVARFREFADNLLSRCFGKRVRSRDVLAIRNLPVPQTDKLTAGRWHLDSLREQVKVFLFLTDVTERSGPLEVLPGSHRAGFKLRGIVAGHLVHPKDFLGTSRRYQKLDDAWVEDSASRSGGPHPILCRAGTAAVVNTSAVHRARPCLENSRYALTAYYDHL